MVCERDKQTVRDALMEMRGSFKREDSAATLESYEQVREAFKGERALRLEATCLAARALVAQKDRAEAHALLKPVASVKYAKAGHYEFLARAFLDLRQHRQSLEATIPATLPLSRFGVQGLKAR